MRTVKALAGKLKALGKPVHAVFHHEPDQQSTPPDIGEGGKASDFARMNEHIIDVMRPMADARGVSVAQIAIAWLLHQRVVSSVIVGVRRFVFISSVKVNGESTAADHAFSAGDAPAPQDPYGISKMEAEIGLRAIAQETGMEVVIVRPPLVYGPGVKANFAALMASAYQQFAVERVQPPLHDAQRPAAGDERLAGDDAIAGDGQRHQRAVGRNVAIAGILEHRRASRRVAEQRLLPRARPRAFSAPLRSAPQIKKERRALARPQPRSFGRTPTSGTSARSGFGLTSVRAPGARGPTCRRRASRSASAVRSRSPWRGN